MPKVKTREVVGMLRSVNSQRTPYKPYGYDLDFSEGIGGDMVYVSMEIPEECIVREGTGYVVIDLKGMNAILRTLADSVDELDREYKKKVGLG